MYISHLYPIRINPPYSLSIQQIEQFKKQQVNNISIYLSISIPHQSIFTFIIVIVASTVVGCHRAATTTVKGNKTATPATTARRTQGSRRTPTTTATATKGRQRPHRQSVRQDNADMWSTLLVTLLLLHLVQLHSTLAMATASGGLTVLEGSSTSSSSSSGSVSSTTGNMLVSSPASSASSTSTSASTSSNASSPLAAGLRKRHRKRNSSWYDYRNYSENNTALEWLNPCGGFYNTPSATERRRVQRPKQVSNDRSTWSNFLLLTHSPLSLSRSSALPQIFNQLKHAAGTEYRTLNNSQQNKGIDIGDMQKWSLYNPNYKFLPKLKPNSTVSSIDLRLHYKLLSILSIVATLATSVWIVSQIFLSVLKTPTKIDKSKQST